MDSELYHFLGNFPNIASAAMKRCGDFPVRCLTDPHLAEQDFFQTLIVSCYVAGMEDGVHICKLRTEGEYEEQR